MTTYAPGTPSWIDLGTPDLDAALRFYTALFGWTAEVTSDPKAGGYTFFRMDGKIVAGASSLLSREQPAVWHTYFDTENADAVATRVEAAGGKVLAPPFDIFGQGGMAVFLDSTGATFSVWQPAEMSGAELVDAPGALAWSELITRDVPGAKAFYGSVFDWTSIDAPMGSTTYTRWFLGGDLIGGMMPMEGDEWPADMPPHWMPYFAVEDADAVAGRAAELGGTVSVPPADVPPGRFARLNDPHGVAFSILAPPPA